MTRQRTVVIVVSSIHCCFYILSCTWTFAPQFDLSTPCDVEEKAHVVDLNGVTSQTQRFDGLTPESCINVTVTPYNSRGAGLSVSRRVCLEAESEAYICMLLFFHYVASPCLT